MPISPRSITPDPLTVVFRLKKQNASMLANFGESVGLHLQRGQAEARSALGPSAT